MRPGRRKGILSNTVWYVQLPSSKPLAFRFDVPVDESVARARARKDLNLKKLPDLTRVWPKPPTEDL
jgi:hypothetical protein